MNINRNTMGHLEVPDFILAKASGERVGVLQCTHKVWTKKYNDIDTLSFEIPYMKNDVLTKYYDDIDVMKYIDVPSLGASFAIKDIDVENEGQKTEYKKVECQSRECLLGQKYLIDFTINTGETGSIDNVSFCNSGLQSKSLLHLVLEKCPDWSLSSNISDSLKSMQRSFEISRQSVYDFLVNDVSEAFECIFIFDSLNKTIGAYRVEDYGIDCNVHVGYNSLLQNTSLSYSIDEVKTAVTLRGDDDLDVREINMGNDCIYNFDYYASEEYFSSSLLTAYNNWKNLVNTAVDTSLFTYKSGVISQADLQGKTYNQAYTLLLQKYQSYYTQLSQWNSTKIPYGINTRKNPGYGTISYTASGSDAVTFAKQTSTVLVTSIPSSGNETTLYLVKNTNNMYRFKGTTKYDVNNWKECCLAELKTLQAGAENLQSVAMKQGYGASDSSDTTIQARYVDTYLPALYMYNALTKQIATVNTTIATLENNQKIIQTDKAVIVNKVEMKNNFTSAQLKELSTFIREEEVTSSNFLVTDSMTESKRFEMLYALLDYGQKELAKVASPQIQFSADLNNLFVISEFDSYSGDFDIGNYVWVTLRDDYSIKAKVLEIEIDFLDQSNFSVTFGNVMRKARNIFTDVTEALNTATSAATSVSFNQSYWSASAEETNSIGKALADGLLGQSYYLTNAEDNETLIDENGVWITTTTGSHGRQQTDNYDSIYLGGGRILFTDDGWRSVRMSVGRADVLWPYVENGKLITKKESRFGTFADFVIAGYLAGSMIVGGHIYSDNYQTNSSNKNSGNYGTHIDLRDGTFEFNSKTSPGKKRLTLNSDGTLEVNGVIHAKQGHIGSDDDGNGGFIIENKKLYNTKSTFNGTSNGIYIGSDEGISLGPYSNGQSPFSVTNAGSLYAKLGTIGGFTITATELYNGKSRYDGLTNGIYMNSTAGISLGKYDDSKGGNPFSVNMSGYLTANSGKIGGFNLNNTTLYNSKTSFNGTTEGIYINSTKTSEGGISLGAYNSTTKRNPFSVNYKGELTSTSGYIGGFKIEDTKLYNTKTSLQDNSHSGVYIGTDGISLGLKDSKTPFYVKSDGTLYSSSGTIGGWSIDTAKLSKYVSGVGTITLDASAGLINVNERIFIKGNGTIYTGSKTSLSDENSGIFISKDGIALGTKNKFKVTSDGVLTSTSGTIGGVTISGSALYTNEKTGINTNKEGIHISSSGIGLGYDLTAEKSPFSVTKAGKLYSISGEIGGWSITKDSISRSATINNVKTKIILDSANNQINVNDKIYLYGDGRLEASSGKFKVDADGNITAKGGTVGGFTIGLRDGSTSSYALYTNGKNALDSATSGVYISANGISLGASTQDLTTKEWTHKFKVTSGGALYSTSGQIGGFTITASKLYSEKSSMSAEHAGVYIGTNGIALGYDSTLTSTNKSPFRVTSDGVLTAKSGTIGGATIEANSIKASNGKWEINSDGSATFSKVTLQTSVDISGVNRGSTFGNFGYDEDGNTWGKFSLNGNSLFRSSASNPFGEYDGDSTTVASIKTISAKYVKAEYIDAINASITTLEADNVTINNTLTAHTASIGTLEADNVTINNTLTAHTASIGTLKTETAKIGKLAASKVDADEVDSIVSRTLENWSGTLRCGKLYVNGWKSTGGQYVNINGTQYCFLSCGGD